MTVDLELKIKYADEKTASAVFMSLEPDNIGHMDSKIVGNELVFVITADNSGTLRNSADDLLACVKIAEEALGLSDAVPDLDGDAAFE